MANKYERGITNIDLTISIILMTIFVTLITTMSYMIHTNFTSIERKSEALSYAITEIENLKAQDFTSLQDTDETTDHYQDITDAEGKVTGYAKKITIVDYANLPENQNDETLQTGFVKKVTVEIAYKDGNTTQTIDLSTAIAKHQ